MASNQIPKHLEGFIAHGIPARLFPFLKLSNGEEIATSILLSIFKMVPELFNELISDAGVRIGKHTKIDVFSEVTLAKSQSLKTDRPDGFIYIKNRKAWTALVEAKVDGKRLDKEQITRYLKAAKENNIDALITISDEFTSRVDHNPFEISGRSFSKIKRYHLSWRLISTVAMLLPNKGQIKDREKAIVIHELRRYLLNSSRNFSRMPREWKELCGHVSRGNTLRTNDEKVSVVANAFVQEFSEIALNLTEHLAVDCTVNLPRRFIHDRQAWQDNIAASICAKESSVHCSFNIPNAANSLDVEINLATKMISFGMEMVPPETHTTNVTKISWLMRQLQNRENDSYFVKVKWNSRAPDESVSMASLHPKYFQDRDTNSVISTLTPMMQLSPRGFDAPKNFIETLEELVISFYDEHAQYLRQAKAPKPVKKA